jgi:hypothetical protein
MPAEDAQMAEMKEFEVYIACNEDGDYEAAAEAEVARDALNENSGAHACRIVKLIVKMSPPAYEAPTAVIEIPDAAGATVSIAAE